MTLKIKRLRSGAHIPGRATAGSAGIDLRACCDDFALQPGERRAVPTGIAIELPDPNMVALLCSRSGLALKQGLTLANGVGVIDSDYRGEIKVPLVNLSDQVVRVTNGERIAQMLVLPIVNPEMIELESLSETERGGGGFGSTGKK